MPEGTTDNTSEGSVPTLESDLAAVVAESLGAASDNSANDKDSGGQGADTGSAADDGDSKGAEEQDAEDADGDDEGDQDGQANAAWSDEDRKAAETVVSLVHGVLSDGSGAKLAEFAKAVADKHGWDEAKVAEMLGAKPGATEPEQEPERDWEEATVQDAYKWAKEDALKEFAKSRAETDRDVAEVVKQQKAASEAKAQELRLAAQLPQVAKALAKEYGVKAEDVTLEKLREAVNELPGVADSRRAYEVKHFKELRSASDKRDQAGKPKAPDMPKESVRKEAAKPSMLSDTGAWAMAQLDASSM